MGDYEERIDEITQTFKEADLRGEGSLNADEFKQALVRLKTPLTDNEIVGVIREVGDGERVKIGKLMGLLGHVEKTSYGIRMALYKIRFGKKLSFKDIKGIFSKLSSGYSVSYSSMTTKSREVLPSLALRPRLDYSGLFFRDFLYSNISKV